MFSPSETGIIRTLAAPHSHLPYSAFTCRQVFSGSNVCTSHSSSLHCLSSSSTGLIVGLSHRARIYMTIRHPWANYRVPTTRDKSFPPTFPACETCHYKSTEMEKYSQYRDRGTSASLAQTEFDEDELTSYSFRHCAFFSCANTAFGPVPTVTHLPLPLSPSDTSHCHLELLSCASVASDWLFGEEGVALAHTGRARRVVD